MDVQQDWMLSYSREENGVTTLRFYRKRDTNDAANDTVIPVRVMPALKAFIGAANGDDLNLKKHFLA